MNTSQDIIDKILATPGVVVNGKPVVSVEPLPIADEMSEKEFMAEVCKLAEDNAWSWHHQTISKRSKSGWPDLTLFRDRVVFIELKSEKGRLDGAQERWRDIIRAAGLEWHCFKPSDWPEILEVLK